MSDSLHPDVPAIDQNVFPAMQSLKELPKIQKALDIAQKQTDQAMAEQVEICEIPSPTFHEEKKSPRDRPPHESIRFDRCHH